MIIFLKKKTSYFPFLNEAASKAHIFSSPFSLVYMNQNVQRYTSFFWISFSITGFPLFYSSLYITNFVYPFISNIIITQNIYSEPISIFYWLMSCSFSELNLKIILFVNILWQVASLTKIRSTFYRILWIKKYRKTSSSIFILLKTEIILRIVMFVRGKEP